MEKIMRLAKLLRDADALSKELIEEGINNADEYQVLSAYMMGGITKIHICHNLKSLAERLGFDVVRTYRGDVYYPYEDSVNINGVTLYEILTAEEAGEDAKMVV